MLSDRSILCFAPDPWDDIWRNRHQIMSLLAERNQVLYVEPRPYLRDVVGRLRQGDLSWEQIRGLPLTHVREGLHVFHQPLYAPLSGRQPLTTLTDGLRIAALKRAMGRLGIAQPILWLFRPDTADVPGRYGESLLVYHIVDEYLGYADVGSERATDIQQRENALLERADLVLVTSRALLEAKGGINPNTHWVANAVDYERFARAAAVPHEPTSLAGLSRPRIGYVGAINDKIDAALLECVAQSHPDGTLVLVGPVTATNAETLRGLDRLKRISNVRFVGRVDVAQVPDHMLACDVGLLPYKRNAWTRHIHPLKMYEYLACGLPIVSTDIPSVHAEADLIQIAEDAAGFVQAIARSLAYDNGIARAARKERASRNTWRDRLAEISRLVEETLAHKGIA